MAHQRRGGLRELKRGAGFLLPGVWGCPPASHFPQDWGIKGVDKMFVNALQKLILEALSNYVILRKRFLSDLLSKNFGEECRGRGQSKRKNRETQEADKLP